jgi:predicted peptidase
MTRRGVLVGAVLMSSLILTALAEERTATMPNQQAHVFEKQVTITYRLEYLLFLPKDYGKDASQKWPLILFLHGAGERGNDVELVKKHGIPKVVEQQPDFPFIAVSPQCPTDSWWPRETAALIGLLDEVMGQYAVDSDRVYLTGLSMGGFGTWTLAAEYPQRFAAIAPICGGGSRIARYALKTMPTWVFHGAKDTVVPPEESQTMVEALQSVGGDVKFTLYPDADHDSWTVTYNNPELYTWNSSQNRASKVVHFS